MKMILDLFGLALKNLKDRRTRSFLTVLGIFIGIAAIVALISLSQGLQAGISSQFNKLGANKLIITGQSENLGQPGQGVAIPLTLTDKDIVNKVNGVDIAIGILMRPVKLEYKNKIVYASITSIPDDDAARKKEIQDNQIEAAQGKILEKNKKDEVMIGADFANQFFKKEINVRDTIYIQGQPFKVVGVLKKADNLNIDTNLLMSESTMRELLNVSDQYDVITATAKTGQNLTKLKDSITRALRQAKHEKVDEESFKVQTSEDIIKAFGNILGILQIVLIGIAAISLVVGGIGVMNTMYTSVLERTREIGIMKSIGAKNSDILLIFLFEAGFLGLVGGAIGVGLGIGIGKTFEVIGGSSIGFGLLKVYTPAWLIIGALAFAFIIGSLAGTLPAIRASKLKPVDALRYE